MPVTNKLKAKSKENRKTIHRSHVRGLNKIDVDVDIPFRYFTVSIKKWTDKVFVFCFNILDVSLNITQQ